MAAMRDSSALIGGILRVIHPELYRAGRLAHDKMKLSNPGLADLIDSWCNPFTAASLISNRKTPAHRDLKSRKPYYDILTSVGQFESVRFDLCNIDVYTRLKPGGVVALCGKIFQHEAGMPESETPQYVDKEDRDPRDIPPTSLGDRLCCAWYMRSQVHFSAGVGAVTWMNRSIYSDCLRSYPG